MDLVDRYLPVPVEPRAIALLNRGVVMALSLTLVGGGHRPHAP